MILDQIAWIDCLAFLLFLAPQLLIQVGITGTIQCACKALPFLCLSTLINSSHEKVLTDIKVIRLPYEFVVERFFTLRADRSPFVRHSTAFQDIVIRCVRYAFAKIPASIGKVFFSKHVALPFFWVRRLRNGVWNSDIHYETIDQNGVKGLFMVYDASQQPDVMVYYCHGGGFSMGSSYFYLEFLLAWTTLLKRSGSFSNPALFALEYSLVPEATYPTQLHEALAGYGYVLSLMQDDSSKICVSGDSAGATLILSLLLSLSDMADFKDKMPGFAVIISPWTTIISDQNRNTPSDYLDADSLKLYGKQYIGPMASPRDPLVSPGSCKTISWWQRASPLYGWYFLYGEEEVFAPDTIDLIDLLKKADVVVNSHSEPAWIHAWPVVKLFLCNERKERVSGLSRIVQMMQTCLTFGNGE